MRKELSKADSSHAKGLRKPCTDIWFLLHLQREPLEGRTWENV